MSDFKLDIELGNAAMRTPADVAAALREVAEKIETGFVPGEGCYLPIVDENGNTVGHYEAAFPNEEDE